MRIKLGDSKNFFDEILTNEDNSLKEFSFKIKQNYSNLKQWRRGERLIPENIFYMLMNYSPNKIYWLKNIKKFEDNWGAKKGGEESGKERDMIYVRNFRKIVKPRIKINEFFCEFYGALLGDGCICRYPDSRGFYRVIITISGNKKLDKKYLEYLKIKLKEEYGVHSYYYEFKTENTNRLTIMNKSLALELNKNFSFPIGEKFGKIKIPKRLLKLPWNIKKLIIRGLFDTDGSICAKKMEKYRYPQISIASKDTKMLKQVYLLLREKDYPCWLSGKNLSIRGKGATIKWFKDIGSSNNRNIYKYKYWLKNKILPPKLLNGPIV